MFEQGGVECGDFRARCAVDEYGVEDIHVEDFTAQTFGPARSSGLHGFAVSGRVNALVVEGGLVAARHAYEIDFQSPLVHEALAL